MRVSCPRGKKMGRGLSKRRSLSEHISHCHQLLGHITSPVSESGVAEARTLQRPLPWHLPPGTATPPPPVSQSMQGNESAHKSSCQNSQPRERTLEEEPFHTPQTPTFCCFLMFASTYHHVHSLPESSRKAPTHFVMDMLQAFQYGKVAFACLRKNEITLKIRFLVRRIFITYLYWSISAWT